MVKIGVLAIQGAFAEHIKAFEKLGEEVIEIRSPIDLNNAIRGLVIPGGESTTMGHFLRKNDFLQRIIEWSSGTGRFIWGTCAGLILLANELRNEKNGGQCSIGGLNIIAERNSFGNYLFSI